MQVTIALNDCLESDFFQVSDEDYESNIALMDRILELDDVDEVFSNQDDGPEDDEDEE